MILESNFILHFTSYQKEALYLKDNTHSAHPQNCTEINTDKLGPSYSFFWSLFIYLFLS